LLFAFVDSKVRGDASRRYLCCGPRTCARRGAGGPAAGAAGPAGRGAAVIVAGSFGGIVVIAFAPIRIGRLGQQISQFPWRWSRLRGARLLLLRELAGRGAAFQEYQVHENACAKVQQVVLHGKWPTRSETNHSETVSFFQINLGRSVFVIMNELTRAFDALTPLTFSFSQISRSFHPTIKRLPLKHLEP
jgi:hypothetical protein